MKLGRRSEQEAAPAGSLIGCQLLVPTRLKLDFWFWFLLWFCSALSVSLVQVLDPDWAQLGPGQFI